MAFIVFEGVDSSGKSTLMNLLCEKLQEKGLNFIQTREPGGTAIGENIREILLSKQNKQLDPLAETLLYYADRKQNITERIQPSLQKGLWIISDRYWASTSAYQCGGRQVDESFVQKLRDKVCAGVEPDLWILLDLPVEESLKRLSAHKKDQKDRMELEASDFHQKVRDYYLKLAKEEPSKWLVLEALKPPQQLLDQILSYLSQKSFFK